MKSVPHQKRPLLKAFHPKAGIGRHFRIKAKNRLCLNPLPVFQGLNQGMQDLHMGGMIGHPKYLLHIRPE